MIGLSDSTLKPTRALENHLDYPLVTTIDREGEAEHQGLHIQHIPASSYAYTTGKNTLNKKMHQ